MDIKPECDISSGYDPIKHEETDDEGSGDLYRKDTNTSNVQPINIKEESSIKTEVKTEDDINTDDERSPEYVVSSSGYNPVKSEETDDEDKCTNTDQGIGFSWAGGVSRGRRSADGNEGTTARGATSSVSWDERFQQLVEYKDQNGHCRVPAKKYEPNPQLGLWVDRQRQLFKKNKLSPEQKERLEGIGFIWVSRRGPAPAQKREDGPAGRYSSKRKREVEDESNVSAEKAGHRICSVEGCSGKAAENGRCFKKHKGYNYCNQKGCTNKVHKGGVCRRHKEFAIVKKVDYVICSVEGCTGKAADSGTCTYKHGGYNLCKHDGCTKAAQTGGVCIKHGPKKERNHRICSVEGCTRKAAGNGMCTAKHGGYNLCKYDGCTKAVKNGGVCLKHGAKVKTCSHEGCTTIAVKRGVCIKHGASWTKKICKEKECTNQVVNRGVCVRHGAVVKRYTKKTCKHDGCTNIVQKGGVCIRHGAKVKACRHDGCTKYVQKDGLCKGHYKLSNGGT